MHRLFLRPVALLFCCFSILSSLNVSATSAPLCDTRGCLDPGINMSPDDCGEARTRAIVQAGDPIPSMLEAAAAHLHRRRNDGLFDAFFLPEDKVVVAKGIDNLLRILNRESTAIVLLCNDDENWDHTHKSLAVSGLFDTPVYNKIPNISYIWLLKRYFTKDSAPKICGDAVATLVEWHDQQTVLLHELLHIRYLSDGFEALQDPPRGERYSIDVAKAFRTGADQRLKPIHSVINWLWYIRLAWTLSRQKIECRDDYPLWDYFTPGKPSSADLNDRINNELRRLLQVEEADPPDTVPLSTETRLLNSSSFANSTYQVINTSGSNTTDITDGD